MAKAFSFVLYTQAGGYDGYVVVQDERTADATDDLIRSVVDPEGEISFVGGVHLTPFGEGEPQSLWQTICQEEEGFLFGGDLAAMLARTPAEKLVNRVEYYGH